MTDSLSSDRLSILRQRAEQHSYVDGPIGVTKPELLALITCAEVMRTAYIYLVRDDRAKALKALTVLEQA